MGKVSYFAAKKLNSYVTVHAEKNSSWIKQRNLKRKIYLSIKMKIETIKTLTDLIIQNV